MKRANFEALDLNFEKWEVGDHWIYSQQNIIFSEIEDGSLFYCNWIRLTMIVFLAITISDKPDNIP